MYAYDEPITNNNKQLIIKPLRLCRKDHFLSS